MVDGTFLKTNVTGTIRLLPGSTGSIVPPSRARYVRRRSPSMLSVSWSSGPSPLDGSAPVRRLIAIRTSASPAPSTAAAIVARRMRGSETATATTAATIPNPPRPSMRILAILISEGDGLSRRRGTTMVGVRGRLKARLKENEESQHQTAEHPRDQNDEQGFHGASYLISLDQPKAPPTVLGLPMAAGPYKLYCIVLAQWYKFNAKFRSSEARARRGSRR